MKQGQGIRKRGVATLELVVKGREGYKLAENR